MEQRPWRPSPNPNPNPRPTQPHLCPSCLSPHFPFCPPLPPPSYYYHAPPPPPPPFHPHVPPYSPRNPIWPPNEPYNLPDAARNLKRPRIDDSHNLDFSEEDERRLKLIRDHGVALATHQPEQQQHNQQNGVSHLQNGQFSTSSYHSHQGFRPSNYHAHSYNGMHAHFHEPHDLRPHHEVNFEGNYAHLNGRVAHYPHPHSMDGSRFFRGQPPLPSSPPPPLPSDPPTKASLFPVSFSSSAVAPSSYAQVPEDHPTPHQPYFRSTQPLPEFSTGFSHEEPSKQYVGDGQHFSLKQLSADKPKPIGASQLFRNPHRASRPDHFVIIFRGLPGSGKSYLAKMLRDLEVENGGDAPRIHSMDDYFMTEVEKVEDNDASKSSSSGRNKKPVTKKVMEYCYEPEMEEAYRSSMLKAFKKTVEEGDFTFVIVDDRNLRVADFAQFWATAKRSGYEVYILEATYKDPAGCAARNVHGFTQEDIEKMARQWEEAPSLYLQLDAKSLFHGDDLKESRILEVDMDMEDDIGDDVPTVQGREAEKVVDPPVRDDKSALKGGKRWDAEGEHPTEVRELGKSKWSEDFGEDNIDHNEGMKGNINALSGLIHHYGKERKSVHWGDQAGGSTGFQIGAARKVNGLSLVIGPGAGYNLKSNPLPKEESPTANSVESKKHIVFLEQIRAERESFKAVFDRRRQRIGGLDVEEG